MSTNKQVKTGKSRDYSKLTPGAREPKPVMAALATAMLRQPEKADSLVMLVQRAAKERTGVWTVPSQIRAGMLLAARPDRP